MHPILLSIYISISLIAMFLVVGVLFPGLLKNSREQFEKTPGRTFWLGLVNVLFIGAVFIGLIYLMENTKIQLILFLIIPIAALFSLGAIVGVSAVTQSIGIKLFPKHGPTKQAIYGALVSLLACLLPFVGWFLLSTYLVISGFGSVTISYYDWRKQKK